MTHYAILGGGRLARHMRHYLSLLGLPCSAWARQPDPELNSHHSGSADLRLSKTIAPASHVLLLVSDGAIASLLKRYPELHCKTLVHCSGAQSIPGVAGAHPLMTFGPELYDLETYRSISFMLDQGLQMSDVLPGLPNSHHHISVERKAQYHALCVMAGNFPQILWQAINQRFEQQGIPAEILQPYLRQVLENFLAAPDKALTGPLSRADRGTIKRNIQSLQSDPMQELYRAFADFYSNEHQASRLKEVTL